MKHVKGSFWQDFLNYGNRNLFHRLLSAILFPAALIYRMAVFFRQQSYLIGLFKTRRLNHPVISVGNLTLGGTGKTPLEIYLVSRCLKFGLRPLILSRGYGSGFTAPLLISSPDALPQGRLADEIELLLRRVGNIPIACGRDRHRAYQEACQAVEFDLVILDDGFQHHKIRRDLDILIVDSTRPYGTGRLLPAGNLREPKTSLKRADIIIVNQKSSGSVKSVIGRPAAKNQLLLAGGFRVEEIISLQQGWPVDSSLWRSRRAGLLTAIADPRAFEMTAAKLGIAPVCHFRFRDHHVFTSSDLEKIARLCASEGIECLFTTEKDAVKLKKNSFAKPEIFVIKVGFYLTDGEEALDERIAAFAAGS